VYFTEKKQKIEYDTVRNLFRIFSRLMFKISGVDYTKRDVDWMMTSDSDSRFGLTSRNLQFPVFLPSFS